MNALRKRALLLVLLWACALLNPGFAGAFSFGLKEGTFALGTWSGGVDAGYEFEDVQSSGAAAFGANVMRNRFDQDVRLSNDGFYIVDPRLIDGAIGGDLDIFQEFDKWDGKKKEFDGTMYGYNVMLRLLSGKPYNAMVVAARHEAMSSTTFGGQIDTLTQNYGINGQLQEDLFRNWLPYFNASIDAHQFEIEENLKELGQTYDYRETRDTLGFNATKGFQTADLNFDYQFIHDAYGGSNAFAFDSQWASLNYSLDFGPNLNRRWDSMITYFTRTGGGEESFLYANERLHIDHSGALSTSYNYLLTDIDTMGQKDLNNTATAQLTYRPYRNLVTNFMLQGMYESLSQGTRDFYAADVAPNYTHSLPWGGSMYISTDARYEIDDDHINGPITVVDEQHTAPAFFGPGVGFDLNNPFVVTQTIVMYDARGGARIPTMPGRDYVVVAAGQLTQIAILPTSLVIRPNDPLTVTYSYEVAANGQYSTTTMSSGAGVQFRYFGINFLHSQLTQTMLSGSGSQFLYSSRQETLQANVHKESEHVDARATAMFQLYDTSSHMFVLKYLMQDYGQYLTFRPGWNLSLRLSGNEMFTRYTSPSRNSSFLSFESDVDRFIGSNALTVFLRGTQITDTYFPTEDTYEFGVRGNIRYGKIHAEPWFSWIYEKWGPITISDPHLMLRVGRDF